MKKLMLFITTILLLSITSSLPLFAQEEEIESEEGKRVIYKKRTVIDFDGIDVTADLKKPHGAYLLDRKKSTFNPMIKLRTDFNAEIYQSVNEVK